jgi:hypothetical protein
VVVAVVVSADVGVGVGGMVASVTCGWKCGKEWDTAGLGCWDISF